MARTQIYNGYTQHVPPAATRTLHSGPGKIRQIIATSASGSAGTVAIYDNTAGSGNLLLTINVGSYGPVYIACPENFPLRFDTGLTVVTPAYISAYFLTEA